MLHSTEVTKQGEVNITWRVRGYENGIGLVYQDFFPTEEEAKQAACDFEARYADEYQKALNYANAACRKNPLCFKKRATDCPFYKDHCERFLFKIDSPWSEKDYRESLMKKYSEIVLQTGAF